MHRSVICNPTQSNCLPSCFTCQQTKLCLSQNTLEPYQIISIIVVPRCTNICINNKKNKNKKNIKRINRYQFH